MNGKIKILDTVNIDNSSCSIHSVIVGKCKYILVRSDNGLVFRHASDCENCNTLKKEDVLATIAGKRAENAAWLEVNCK